MEDLFEPPAIADWLLFPTTTLAVMFKEIDEPPTGGAEPSNRSAYSAGKRQPAAPPSHDEVAGETIAKAIGVSKSFGGVHALREVSLDLLAGEIHALCGENGAGKSTLIKILSGFYAPDAGSVQVDGQPLPPSVHAASERGVSVIHQESVACFDLDAVDNIFVGRERRQFGGLLLDRAAMEEQTREMLARLGESFPIDRPVGALTLAQRQMIGIARALSQRCRLLIMDEPTASLSTREAETLFRIMRQLRSEGVAILYVSHRLEEIFSLADRVTVLRDGRHVATKTIEQVTPAALINLMVGRDVEPVYAIDGGAAKPSTTARLEVCNLSRHGCFTDISFAVRPGEVVGIAGLVGAGRSEVIESVFGAADYDAGTVLVDGQPLKPGSIAASIGCGIALVPEDRQHDGLVLPMSVEQNLTLAILRDLTCTGLVQSKLEQETASRLAKELDIRAARLSLPAETLSGGNQQKIVIGKWLATRPRTLMLDEPTRGVDVAAKAEIHRRIRQLTAEGMATVVISSELPEILRLSDRILVMREGRFVGELRGASATEQQILELGLPGASAGAESGESTKARQTPRYRWREVFERREAALVGLLLVILAAVGAFMPSFLSMHNLLDIGAEAAPVAIIACAVCLVVVTGEIDISVGSLVGFAAAILGLCSYGPDAPLPVPAGAACALAAAVGIGMLNGFLTTVGRVPSIIATLGVLTMLRGVTKLIMEGRSIEGRPEALRTLATGTWLQVPNSIWIGAVIVLALAVVARRTVLGRRMYAVGSNPQGAPLLGISVSATRFIAFALSGLMAGVAALLLAPKNSIIQPNLGEGLELLAITGVVVGGASISGGRGTMLGTVLAILFLSLIPTALTYVGAPAEWRLAIQGTLILVAVLADHSRRKSRTRGGPA